MSDQCLWILATPQRFPTPQKRLTQSLRRPRSQTFFCSPRRARFSATSKRSSPPRDGAVNAVTTQNHPEESPRPVAVLPLDVVQRIAAGEVIIGFESVIQELVENAIDARASEVSVHIDFKASSVTVKDNGVGVSAEQDLPLIAQCNATSKLRSLGELDDGVSTLGFRGQGLWAIAAKAQSLVIASRIEDSLHGTSVTFSRNGSPILGSVSPAPMAIGTVVSVRGLPWSLTGRELSKAVRKCKIWLARTSLSHPSITFQLKRDGKLCWQRVYKGGTKGDSILQSLANEVKMSPSDFRHGSASLPGLGSVEVVIGLPSRVHVSSRLWFTTALNGRSVTLEALSRTILPLFSVPKGRFPVVFAKVGVSCGLVDWNISPMKANVRFKDSQTEQKVVDAVSGIVNDLLQGISGYELDHVSDYRLGVSSRGSPAVQALLSSISSNVSDSHDEWKNCSETIDAHATFDLTKGLGHKARVVAQVLGTYILIERDGGILLVEQHVADERILYERLLQEWKTSSFVYLRNPIQLPDSFCDEDVFCLTSLGLNVESTNIIMDQSVESVYIVRSVPKMLSDLPPKAILSVLVQFCSDAITIETAAASVACNLAVRNGTVLQQKRMIAIVKQLMDCQNPHTCPHGRPVFVELGTRELARIFGRSWSPERFRLSEDVDVDVRETRQVSFGRSQGVLPE